MPPARARSAATASSVSPMSAKKAASAAARAIRRQGDLVAPDPTRCPPAVPRLGQLVERSLRASGRPSRRAVSLATSHTRCRTVARTRDRRSTWLRRAATGRSAHSPRELGDHRVDPVIGIADVRSYHRAPAPARHRRRRTPRATAPCNRSASGGRRRRHPALRRPTNPCGEPTRLKSRTNEPPIAAATRNRGPRPARGSRGDRPAAVARARRDLIGGGIGRSADAWSPSHGDPVESPNRALDEEEPHGHDRDHRRADSPPKSTTWARSRAPSQPRSSTTR